MTHPGPPPRPTTRRRGEVDGTGITGPASAAWTSYAPAFPLLPQSTAAGGPSCACGACNACSVNFASAACGGTRRGTRVGHVLVPVDVTCAWTACSVFDADFHGVDPVRVKRQEFPDCRYGGIRSLVAPDGVD